MRSSGRGAGKERSAPILVGIDGSPSSQEALDWAAGEASATRRPLHIVHCFLQPVMELPPWPAGDADGPRRVMELPPRAGGRSQPGGIRAGERLLAQAELFARLVAPDITVTGELLVGAPAPALLREAEGAALVVLGNRGIGGFLGLLVGSVGVAVAGHARCPVVVVHPRPKDRRPSRRFVVGVDAAGVSAAPVDFVFETAALHGGDVTAVLAWSAPVSVGHPARRELVRDTERMHRRLLDKALAGARQRFPDVFVAYELVQARPAQALVEESVGADLVVVGSRGRSGLRGLLQGSVSQAVLHHAQCPVAVVRRVGARTRSPATGTNAPPQLRARRDAGRHGSTEEGRRP